MAGSNMPPICEDLADYGVVLLPPSTTDFELLALGISKHAWGL